MPEVLTLRKRDDGLARACEREPAPRRAACPRVIVVARSRLLRDALEAALAATSTLEVVVTAETPDDLSMPAVHRGAADALLMDMAPSCAETIEQVRALAATCPHLRIIILDVVQPGPELLDLVEAGASGLLLKSATVDEILRTTWAVLAGATVIPQSLTRPLLSAVAERARRAGIAEWHDVEQVTRREHQIVALIAEGLSNKEIATALNIATLTVKSHVHNVLQKLGLQTRAQIARSFLLKQAAAVPAGAVSRGPSTSASRSLRVLTSRFP